jgi:uncharacterized membrane protein YkoI
MKNLIFVLSLIAFFSLNACGQTDKDVPANVKTAFLQKFPNAIKVKWDNEEQHKWEAEFKMDGKEYSANFDTTGVWKETEFEINVKEIPAAVKTTLDKEFAGYKIKESEISETPGGKVYEFELKKSGEDLEVVIDLNGKVISKDDADDEND